jgi:hypothetical protein
LFDAIEQLLFEGAEVGLGRSPLGKKVGIFHGIKRVDRVCL